MNSVLVVGAGAFGTALAIQAHRAGARVALWSRSPLRGRESPRLPGFPIPEGVRLGAAIDEAADLLVLAVPMQHLRAIAAALPSAPAVLLACKGVEAGTLRLPLEVLAETRPAATAAVLSGPNFAHEVAAGLPAASVVASGDAALRAAALARLSSPTFRLYGNDDPLGVQLGGAAKNVIALAAGAVVGAGLGENARAALVTRGLAELGRLVAALGGRAETVAGLSGLGDLLLTCTGAASRNFRCGQALGQGHPLPEAIASAGGTVEGVATAPALLARAAGVELPVIAAVAALLEGRETVAGTVSALLSRPLKHE